MRALPPHGGISGVRKYPSYRYFQSLVCAGGARSVTERMNVTVGALLEGGGNQGAPKAHRIPADQHPSVHRSRPEGTAAVPTPAQTFRHAQAHRRAPPPYRVPQTREQLSSAVVGIKPIEPGSLPTRGPTPIARSSAMSWPPLIAHAVRVLSRFGRPRLHRHGNFLVPQGLIPRRSAAHHIASQFRSRCPKQWMVPHHSTIGRTGTRLGPTNWTRSQKSTTRRLSPPAPPLPPGPARKGLPSPSPLLPWTSPQSPSRRQLT
jgi:hypothetical protein